MKLTWYGHSAFRIEAGDAQILIDPFLSGNPSWNGGWEAVAEGVTHVLLTHGHDDHIGDSLDILTASGAMLVANFEICMHMVGQGLDEHKINPGNHGGTVDCGGFTTSFVKAEHSSSRQTGGGGNVYLGNPAGLVLTFADAPTLYHMGDTDIFSDMALIAELHRPQVGIVPIGDRFTMGGATAALACRRFFNFTRVVPCHYGSFPIIDQTPDAFLASMEEEADKVLVPKVGQAVTL
ncbi:MULTISPECIES: metal-dependent hydrolase [unclassified Roseitalea]|uniref:metal-dependent hydrolase n=1 Tax=unclassified Roseitalea TaxID=2639107 RepID=UPI00273FEEC8|nr:MULTISPECIES: metal-dependent hydrolase [unclassified Roseitalea]